MTPPSLPYRLSGKKGSFTRFDQLKTEPTEKKGNGTPALKSTKTLYQLLVENTRGHAISLPGPQETIALWNEGNCPASHALMAPVANIEGLLAILNGKLQNVTAR